MVDGHGPTLRFGFDQGVVVVVVAGECDLEVPVGVLRVPHASQGKDLVALRQASAELAAERGEAVAGQGGSE